MLRQTVIASSNRQQRGWRVELEVNKDSTDNLRAKRDRIDLTLLLCVVAFSFCIMRFYKYREGGNLIAVAEIDIQRAILVRNGYEKERRLWLWVLSWRAYRTYQSRQKPRNLQDPAEVECPSRRAIHTLFVTFRALQRLMRFPGDLLALTAQTTFIHDPDERLFI